MIKNLTKNHIISLILLLDLVFSSESFAVSTTLNQGLDYLTSRITSDMGLNYKNYVAVVDFVDLNGMSSELGKFVAEELLTRIYNTQKVKVVERRLLEKVLEEARLGMTGFVDERSAKKLGKLLGVDALCTGTITDLQETFKINARVVATESGEVFAVASAEIDKSDALRLLMRRYSQTKRLVESKEPEGIKGKGVNLVINGSFTDEYNGWQKHIGDIRQGSSKSETDKSKVGKSGYVLHITHEGKGHLQYSQTVKVPTADLIFSITFQAGSHEGAIKAFSGTGVVQIGLQYLDQQGQSLGKTVLLNYVKNPFADTGLIGVPRRERDSYKTHFIEFESDRLFNDYQIDIKKEIQNNLMGVDAEAIEEIAVVLWCGADHPGAGAELWVTDIELRIK